MSAAPAARWPRGDARRDVGIDRQPADEIVTRREDDRREECQHQAEHPNVLRPVSLADEEKPAGHDQQRAGDEGRLERLTEQNEGDGDREERPRADDDRRPRGALPHARRT